MRHTKVIMIAVFATVALSGLTATSAAAFHPLFLTQSGKELLVTGEGNLGILRSLTAGVLGTVECHKILAHGWVVNKSTLVKRVTVSLHTKCELTVGSTKTACTEPIVLKEGLGELGLLVTPSGKKIVVALGAPTTGTEFVKFTCGSNTTTVEGAVVGEIPEINKKLVNQYNKQLTEGEGILAAENKGENQQYTTIELLGVQMTKAELKVSGFFGGKASVEASEVGKNAGWIEICTLAPANCP
jgi:hypothetical protein